MSFSGIILAAGSSRRMGQPKALLTYRGETFLERLKRLFGTVCSEVVVVGSPDSPFAADVLNPEPERGMLSSLQCGLRAVGGEAEAVLFTPVDSPAVEAATLAILAGGWGGELLRIPRHAGRRGHPVMMARRMVGEFLAETKTPREVIVRHEADVVYVDVDDAGILSDADTPLEYQKLISNG
jgi:molybdenum cofactor cytidylyltransferase